ncbi:hypothetical protein ACE7GA_02925 [Roseomonas sp. CCTCC AB2023176]|uniref:hypothetical protein n=1 Tax=Roseomonas sp. CCTCC AB2023176 TaxID=3342640 RepID=UPI0035E088C6
MASLVKLYGRQFRQHLSYHPVWQPGTAVVPGDWGVLHDGVFTRQGHVTDLPRVPRPALRHNRIEAPQRFSVGVSFRASAGVAAKPDPSLAVEGSLRFERSGAVVYSARDLTATRMDNLATVLSALPWLSKPWTEDTVLVTEVIAAERAGFALAESDGGEVKVSGKASALSALDVADASVAFGASSAATFAMRLQHGKKPHPVALVLYKAETGIFGRPKPPAPVGGPGMFGADAGDEPAEPELPYRELSPFEVED